MRRKTLMFGGLAVAAMAALLAWAFAPRPVEVEVARADRGAFETAIAEDGRTRLHDRYVVSAPLAGRLARITLRAGDVIKAGAEVASLMPALAPMIDARSRRELEARVEAARSNVQRAERSADAARITLEQARSELKRTEQLAQRGFVSPTKAETDRLTVAAASKALDAAIAGRNVTTHELEVARAALASAQPGADGVGRFVVSSPISGRVLRVLQASEGMVSMGTPLLEVGDTTQLEIVAELLTTDALQARPGSLVRIEQWGGEGTLEGRVREVEPAAFTKVSALGVEEQRVNVLIDLTSPQPSWQALGDAYRVGVRIVTQQVDDALRVPVSAVFPLPPQADDAPGGHGVFVVDGGRAKQVKVEIGARNGRHAWVLEGLAAGDTVIVYPPTAVADGVRVKVRQT